MKKYHLIFFNAIVLSLAVVSIHGACDEGASGGGGTTPTTTTSQLPPYTGAMKLLEAFVQDFSDSPPQRTSQALCTTTSLYGSKNFVDFLANSNGTCNNSMFTSTSTSTSGDISILPVSCWVGKYVVEGVQDGIASYSNVYDLRNSSINSGSLSSVYLRVPSGINSRIKFYIYEPCQSACSSSSNNTRIKWTVNTSNGYTEDITKNEPNTSVGFKSEGWSCQ
jgi:hypothetical protein